MAINKRIIKSNEGGAAVGASFNTVIYDGNGGTKNVTGVGFQPDFVWVKNRDNGTRNHKLFDSVRGVQKFLVSNTTDAEVTDTNALESFDIDGYTTGSDGSLNTLNNKYVAWCWKAGGAAVTNTDGTITSQVSANVEAGFSVVSYTTPTNLTAFTVGHGLEAAPSVIIVKDRVTNGVGWHVFHSSLSNPQQSFLELNTTAAVSSSPAGIWNNTLPTDSVFSQIAGYATAGNAPSIAYCFADVAGFSKFGSYSGTNAAGNIQDCGFEPAFVMIKATNLVDSWYIFDNKRDVSNPRNIYLKADTSAAEVTVSSPQGINFLSNGFEPNSFFWNDTGLEFIYMAFANQF